MFFNSIDYLFFLLIIFFLYWFIFNKKLNVQNYFLLISSYFFYAWWDWRFLTLIFISTLTDYLIGLKIYSLIDKKKRRLYLYLSIAINLTILGYFKYFNFFLSSLNDLLIIFGYQQKPFSTLNIILPVGISFYTFQTISYSFEIYFKKLKPTKNFAAFALFVSFFPQLVAGPIEKARNLLPQILKFRKFNYNQSVIGIRLIIWGMFKKIVIADSLSWRVNYCYENFQILDGGSLFLGLIYFSFQLYCDFSGYSDIAIGTSNLLGFKLIKNFNFPFLSRDITEFWNRWHISLSNWFKDHLFIPLLIKFRSYGSSGVLLSTLISFTLIGLWHGANYNFLIFGFFHGILFIPTIFFKRKKYKNDFFKTKNFKRKIIDLFLAIKIFIYFSISLVFFRSENLNQAINYLWSTLIKFSIPADNRSGILFIFLLLIFELTMQRKARNPLLYKNPIVRYLIYFLISFLVISHFQFNYTPTFIYFRF